MEIYIGKEGQIFGPYYLDEIQKRLEDGRFDNTEKSWHEGLDEWVNVKKVMEEKASEPEAAEEPESLDEESL